MKKTLKVLMGCGMALLLCSCSRVAVTGRQRLNLVPDRLMNQLSLQSYSEFLNQNAVSGDAEATRQVKTVGARIQRAVERYAAENEISELLKDYEWEFNLVEDEAVNAWAMPGGKVVVYTGILPIAQDETGLAVVMGHEIAHVIAKHGSERMTQGLLVQMGGMALSEAISTQPALTQALFKRSYGAGAQYGVLLPHSRLHESEADRMGLIFMAMADYNPTEAVGFWQRMAAAKDGAAPPEFMSTHPADKTRIRKLEEHMPEAMEYYERARGD